MANARPESVRRGRDEVGFLKSRARSTPLGAVLVRERAARLRSRALAEDERSGAEAHDQGTELVELYMRHADAVLGHASFKDFLEEHWPLDLSVAYERMQIARLCTQDQAEKYGYSACVLGIRIMRQLEIASFEEFSRTPLELHPADGGGVARFPAPAKALRSVLRLLATRASAGGKGDVTRQFRRYRQLVDELSASDEGVAAIKPIVWADAKGVYVRVTAGGRAQVRAAALLYQRLGRIGD